MCVYFDDVDVPAFIEEHSAQLGSAAVTAGRTLTERLRVLPWPDDGGFVDPTALISSPAWSQVLEAARLLQDALPLARSA